MIVTAVVRQKRRRRVDLYVDGELALAVGLELAVERDIHPGRTLIRAELAALAEEDARRLAFEAALRSLAYRPRSEKELRDRLSRRGFSRRVVGATLDRLRGLGYLDDAAYARFYAETQQASRPRSRRLLQVELRRRGVAPPVAEEATEGVSDEDAAYLAAQRRVGALRGLEYQRFRERLGSFLTRRGFSYEVARRTLDRCWAELSGEADGK